MSAMTNFRRCLVCGEFIEVRRPSKGVDAADQRSAVIVLLAIGYTYAGVLESFAGAR